MRAEGGRQERGPGRALGPAPHTAQPGPARSTQTDLTPRLGTSWGPRRTRVRWTVGPSLPSLCGGSLLSPLRAGRRRPSPGLPGGGCGGPRPALWAERTVPRRPARCPSEAVAASAGISGALLPRRGVLAEKRGSVPALWGSSRTSSGLGAASPGPGGPGSELRPCVWGARAWERWAGPGAVKGRPLLREETDRFRSLPDRTKAVDGALALGTHLWPGTGPRPRVDQTAL